VTTKLTKPTQVLVTKMKMMLLLLLTMMILSVQTSLMTDRWLAC